MAAVTLGSCSNEEIGGRNILPDENGRMPIAITTYLPQTTRGYNAQEATISSLSNSGGGFTINAVNTKDNSSVIDNWTYTASSDGTCTPANASLMAYWPNDDSNVNFFAYYPSNGNMPQITRELDTEAKNLTIWTDGTVDIMAAYTQAKQSDGGNVLLAFKHLTAKTIINVKCDKTGQPSNIYYELDSVIINAPATAYYFFAKDSMGVNESSAIDYHYFSVTDGSTISLEEEATNIGTAMLAASSGRGNTCTLTVGYTTYCEGRQRNYVRTANVTLVAGHENAINVSVQGDMPLTINAVVENMEPIVDGHVYVDLGLPSGLLWATMNVGASKPEEYGDYFAWGETEPYYSVVGNDTIWKEGGYVWDNYKYCSSDEYMTKYVHDDRYGTVDNKRTLESDDDAATVNWGGSWRMPTNDELEELLNAAYCTQEATTVNGVSGRKFTSVSNGNSIFFPFAGSIEGIYLRSLGTSGYSWTSSLASADTKEANFFSFWNASANNYSISSRYIGMPVRAVHPAE